MEFTEFQVLLDEINDNLEKDAELHENETEAKRYAVDVEKAKAAEVRHNAMETFGETRKRNKENRESEADMASPPSSKRRSGSETLRYLQEGTEQLRKSQEEDAKLKKEEVSLRKAEVDGMQTSVQAMAQTMQNSQQQMVNS